MYKRRQKRAWEKNKKNILSRCTESQNSGAKFVQRVTIKILSDTIAKMTKKNFKILKWKITTMHVANSCYKCNSWVFVKRMSSTIFVLSFRITHNKFAFSKSNLVFLALILEWIIIILSNSRVKIITGHLIGC